MLHTIHTGLSTSYKFYSSRYQRLQLSCTRWPFHSKDVITFNAAIAACGKASRWRHALQLFFQALKDSGFPWETKTTLDNGVKLSALQVKIMR